MTQRTQSAAHRGRQTADYINENIPDYILPALMLGLIVLKLYFALGKARGHGMTFLGIAFGPSLLYALITDEGSSTLFCISVLAALIATSLVIWFTFRKPRASQLIYIGKNDQKLGPFTVWQIGQKFGAGEISRNVFLGVSPH